MMFLEIEVKKKKDIILSIANIFNENKQEVYR